jgi:hypothetical protein
MSVEKTQVSLQSNKNNEAFIWVIPWRLNFICRRFGTVLSYLPAYENGTDSSETSGYKIQPPGNYPEHSEHGEI